MRIAIERSDGGVSIMSLDADEDVQSHVDKWEAGELYRWSVADDAARMKIWGATPWKALRWQEIAEDQLPPRLFRNAYEFHPEKGAAINMEKARGIRRCELRTLRAPKLAALDVAYQRADEAGDKAAKAEIAAKKQALRDVTRDAAIDFATTPEQLAAVLPEVLAT